MCLHRVEKVTPHTRPQCQCLHTHADSSSSTSTRQQQRKAGAQLRRHACSPHQQTPRCSCKHVLVLHPGGGSHLLTALFHPDLCNARLDSRVSHSAGRCWGTDPPRDAAPTHDPHSHNPHRSHHTHTHAHVSQQGTAHLSLCRMMSLMLLMLTGYLRVVRASTRQASVNRSSTSRFTFMSSVLLLKRGPRSRGDLQETAAPGQTAGRKRSHTQVNAVHGGAGLWPQHTSAQPETHTQVVLQASAHAHALHACACAQPTAHSGQLVGPARAPCNRASVTTHARCRLPA